MAFSVAPSVQYTERDATLFTKAAVTVSAAFSGVAPWGEANSPVQVTSGEQELVAKFFKPNDKSYQDFLVVADYMKYSNSVYFNRLIGASAKNSVNAGQTPVLVDNKDAFDSGTFDNDVTYIGRYPGALGDSLAVAIADKDTFDTWDFKDNFEYAPVSEGEYALCVVDTTGAITGGNAGRGQVNKFTVDSGFGHPTLDGHDLIGPTSGDIATQYRNGYVDSNDTSVYGSAVVSGSSVELERANFGDFVVPSSTVEDFGVNTGITATWSISEAAVGVKEIQTITFQGTNTTDGNVDIAHGGITLWSVPILGADTVAEALDKIKAVVEADTSVEAVTTNPSGSGSFTIEFRLGAGKVTALSAITTGLGFTGVNVAITTAQVNTSKQKDTVTFSVTTLVTTHTITLDDEAGVDVVLNRGDSQSVVISKIAAGMRASVKYASAEAFKGYVLATMAEFDKTYVISTSKDVAVGSLTKPVITATKSDTPFLGTVIETEVYELVRNEPTATHADGSTAYFVDAINDGSGWIYTATESLVAGWYPLQGGVDDYNVDRVSGFEAYKNAIKYGVSAIVDSVATVDSQQAAIDVCIKRRDAVAFISPPMAKVVGARGRETANIKDWSLNEVLRDSSYFFQDDNWGYVWDKYNSKWRWIPCCGGTAGLRARTHTLFGPWKSFAFHNRGKYGNYKKTAWSADDDQRLELYKAKVNSIVTQSGGGIVLMGDKTGLSRPSAFDRCNVRDTFIMMEQNVSGMAKYFLGENNDEFTRGLFLNTVRPYIRNLEDQGAILEGKVKCDETNNTGQVIASNTMKAGIWVKPQYSINWIFLDFAALRPDMSFDELEGASGIATAG
ncbi:tail sheath protein [Vibrio phage 1.244.A._10N.261.54.C3]|nr:tail sheath protein [Vibrio phage 1.244.A._10N.261.54.C3]AUR98632.1 tail sheath protein [Vibrio phage 1.255.O._10N.286.45.F1]